MRSLQALEPLNCIPCSFICSRYTWIYLCSFMHEPKLACYTWTWLFLSSLSRYKHATLAPLFFSVANNRVHKSYEQQTSTLCLLPLTCFLHSHFKPSDQSSYLVKLISPAHIGHESSFAISPSSINQCTNISFSCIRATRLSYRHLQECGPR